MPIYEFQCNNEDCEANLRYEKEFKITEPHRLHCQFCGDLMTKIYSSIGVVFKAQGFYSTDNRR